MADLSKDRLMQLRNEIRMSEALNREELEPVLQECLQRYCGKYIPAYTRDWDLVLNEIYPIIQNLLPSIFFRNPRAFLKPRTKFFIAKRRDPISGKMEDVQLDSTKSAKTQENILNYEINRMKYKKEARTVLFDALIFPYGVMWHGYKGDFGMTEESSYWVEDEQVFVKRINPMHFIHDPTVGMSSLDEGRWVGRVIDVPLADFYEDDKLDIDKELIKGYKAFGTQVGAKSRDGLYRMGERDEIKLTATNKPLINYTDQEFQQSRYSKFVRCYEIYVRATKKEQREGKRGYIVLLTPDQQKPLRVSEWTIKAKGFPALILQFNELPDAMFGLSDIDTYKQIADQKNAIINLQLRNAQETSKTMVGISKAGANEEDIEKVQKGENTIITFEDGNPSERMYVANMGGNASSELYMLDQRIQKNLDDKSGVNDLKRGVLQSGEESATSVQIRNAGSSARPAYRQDIMADFLKDSFLYINDLLKQFMPVEEAVRVVGSLDIEWSDKPTKEELQAHVDIELDAISMLPESPEREMQELQTILTLMINAITQPQIMQKIQQEGKTFNFAPIIEQMLLRLKIRDPDVFRSILPQESQGFVSVAEVRAAKDNVNAALAGQQPPSPPQEGQDHGARLEIYSEIAQILQAIPGGNESIAGALINQLMQLQAALLQAEQEKEGQSNTPVKLQKPSVQTVGA